MLGLTKYRGRLVVGAKSLDLREHSVPLPLYPFACPPQQLKQGLGPGGGGQTPAALWTSKGVSWSRAQLAFPFTLCLWLPGLSQMLPVATGALSTLEVSILQEKFSPERLTCRSMITQLINRELR